jgi:hypothetical protein
MIGKGPSRSRLLGALEAAIKAAANPIEAQCLRAERAALLARQGQLERAQGVIDELQSQLAWQPNNTMLRAWLALAEGLHSYYSVIGLAGRESVELAYALAKDGTGASGQRLRATTAAWLANMAFAYDDFARMAALAREALDTARIAGRTHGPRWWPASPITTPAARMPRSSGTRLRAAMPSPRVMSRTCRH